MFKITSLEDFTNSIIEDYSEIASILGLPPNSSTEEKKRLISKLKMLQDPNISAAEKASIIDEILRLKENLSDTKKNEILKVLDSGYVEEATKEIVKEFSKIASLLGIPPNATLEEKKKLFSKLEAFQDPNIETSEKALILDEILRLNGKTLSEEVRAEILKALKLDELETTKNSIVAEYSKIASILGISPNASKDERKNLLMKIEELKDPNIGIKEKAKIIDDILRLKGNISKDLREELLKELTNLLARDEKERVVKEVKVAEKLGNQYETVNSIESILNDLENFSVDDKRKLLDSIFELQDILKRTKSDVDLSFSEKFQLEKEKKKLIEEINDFLKDSEDKNGDPITIENILPYPLDDSSEFDPDLLLNKDLLYKVIAEEEESIKNEIKDLEDTLTEKPLTASEKRIILEKIEELKELLEALSRRYDDLELRYQQRIQPPSTKLSPERIRLFMKLYKINDAIAFLERRRKKPKPVGLTQRRKVATRKPNRFTQGQLNRFYLNRKCKNVFCNK